MELYDLNQGTNHKNMIIFLEEINKDGFLYIKITNQKYQQLLKLHLKEWEKIKKQIEEKISKLKIY